MKIFSRIPRFTSAAITIIVFTFSSCDSGNRIDYNLKTNFIYKNTVSENIEIILFNKNDISFKSYLIEPNKEIIVSLTQEGSKTGLGQPFALENDIRYIATKVILKFTLSNKCLTHLEGTGVLNVKSYDNFLESMYSTSNNTLIYNIGKEEFDFASQCQ